MKRISVKESRRNSVNCGRKVRARQMLAGRFCAQAKPMFGSKCVHYEVSAHGEAMSYGGIAAVHRLVTRLGLVKAIDATLKLLKVHLPYHESDHVLNLVYNVMCGGTRLEDIERLRSDGAYMNALNATLIPDPTTAGDFTRRFHEADVIGLMESINAVRPKLWRTRAASLLAPVAYIDVDGTSAPTYGEKKGGMDISYKGVWGYAPLIVSLANTKEVLYVVNRPGNASSHQGGRTLDRCGHRAGDAPRTAFMPTRRHGLFADRPLRSLVEDHRFHLRDGRQQHAAKTRRGPPRSQLAAPAPACSAPEKAATGQ